MPIIHRSDIHVGTPLHFIQKCSFEVGPKGGIKEHHTVWYVTNIKTWKRDPNRIKVRIKVTIHHGLRGWDYLDETYFDRENSVLCLEKDCPAVIESKRVEKEFHNFK